MRPRQDTPARTLGDVAATVLLGLVLVLPLGGRFLDPGAATSALVENRSPAPLPPLPSTLERVETYPGRFKAWLDDGFGFRGPLVRWHNELKLFGFAVAPTDRAVLGPEQWIFTTANKTFEAYRGTFQLTDVELEQWLQVLEARRALLAELGIEYVFCFAPAKPTLYPEQLPAGYRRGPQTTLEQLLAYLAEHSDFEVLDLHQPLLAAREDDRAGDTVYYQLGTHWTERGGFIAARTILAQLAARLPGLEQLTSSDYSSRPGDDEGDSWAARFHVPDLLVQRRIEYRPLEGWRTTSAGAVEKDLGTRTGPQDEGLRLLLLHDSFGEALWPFLAESFAFSSSHIGFEIDPDRVAAVRPDVVVQVMAERRLESYHPKGALSGAGAVARRVFERAPQRVARLETPAELEALTPWAGATFTWSEPVAEDLPALQVSCRGGEQGFLLPELELPSSGAPVLRLDLTSNVTTSIAVHYLTAEEDEYSPGRAIEVALRKGRNVLYFTLPTERVIGRLLVHPLRRRGRYDIHAIEVRATR